MRTRCAHEPTSLGPWHGVLCSVAAAAGRTESRSDRTPTSANAGRCSNKALPPRSRPKPLSTSSSAFRSLVQPAVGPPSRSRASSRSGSRTAGPGCGSERTTATPCRSPRSTGTSAGTACSRSRRCKSSTSTPTSSPVAGVTGRPSPQIRSEHPRHAPQGARGRRTPRHRPEERRRGPPPPAVQRREFGTWSLGAARVGPTRDRGGDRGRLLRAAGDRNAADWSTTRA